MKTKLRAGRVIVARSICSWRDFDRHGFDNGIFCGLVVKQRIMAGHSAALGMVGSSADMLKIRWHGP